MYWFRRLFRKETTETQLDKELRFHLERRTVDYIQQGFSPEESRRQAQIEFGGVEGVKEECRESRRIHLIETLLQDLRYGLRMMRRNPGFTWTAVLTLALGIGANTAIFTLINATMLRSLPVTEPQQLYAFKWTARNLAQIHIGNYSSDCLNRSSAPTETRVLESCVFSYPMIEQFRAEQKVFSGVLGFRKFMPLAVRVNGNESDANAFYVSGDFFPTLGVQTVAGRLLGPVDDEDGAAPVVVLGYDYWQSRFGGDPGIVGKLIHLKDKPFAVVGVVGPKFKGLENSEPADLWLSLSSQYALWGPFLPKKTDAKSIWIEIWGRLKPGVTPAQAEAAINHTFVSSVTTGAGALFKPEDAPHIELVAASRGLHGLQQSFARPLLVLMVTAGFVLLIACANLAGLLLVRGAVRQKEMVIRTALGASRGRAMRQLLTESTMIAALSGGLGFLFACLSAKTLAAFLAAHWFGNLSIDVRPDLRILVFTVVISAITVILFGLMPAFRGTGADVTPVLKANSSSGAGALTLGGRRFRLSGAIVFLQVGLSIVLLSGAGLLVRTFVNLETLNVGFDTHNVVVFNLEPEKAGYKHDQVRSLSRDLQGRFAALPGVESASYSAFPLLSGAAIGIVLESPEAPGKGEEAQELDIGPNFLETMRMPLVSGRPLTVADFESKVKPAPVIVNQLLAARFFGRGNAVGRLLANQGSKTADWQIVGVVGDAKYQNLRSELQPTVYMPLSSRMFGIVAFQIRTAQGPKTMVPLLRGAIQSVNRSLTLYKVSTQREGIENSLYQERLVAWLSSLFAGLALMLAGIGLYGMLAYEVTRRTQEIGICMALGARTGDILRLVIAQGVVLTAAGAVAGIAAAVGLTRYLQSLLYGVRATDATTYIGAATVLVLASLAACYFPARRAMRVDPMIALRYE